MATSVLSKTVKVIQIKDQKNFSIIIIKTLLNR